MDINDALIDKLADLAKLEFEGPAKEAIRQDLKKVVAFVDTLNALDTTGVEPLIFMSDAVNVLREDVAVQSIITHEEALLNAPKKDSDYFRVPKFLEK